jgi:prepilin-type N-terminal cleavage/methylation domain-containing protein
MNGPEKTEKKEGFTLVELMVVIGLIAILTGIGWMSILHYRALIRVNASARDMAGHLRVARAQAVRNGQPVQVAFDGPDGAYTVVSNLTQTYYLQGGIKFGSCPGLPAVPGHPWPANPAGIDIPNGQTSVLFYGDGTASVSGAAYIIPFEDLSTTGMRPDRQRAVDWEATTGRIRDWQFYANASQWR